MKQTKLILTSILILYTSLCFGRLHNKHEVFFSAGVGLHQLQYAVNAGNISSNPGGMVGLGYTYFITDSWGISTGIEGAYYNTMLKLDEFTSVTKDLNDGEGHIFDFHSTVKNYSETQKAYMLSIPLMGMYQTKGFNKFYISAGVKFGIPFGSYESDGTYINKGYFPERDNWAIDQKFMGFGVFENEKNDDKLQYNLSLMLALELGAKWFTDSDWSVYTGIYGEYGVNPIINPNETKDFITYQSDIKNIFTNGSALESTYTNNDNQVIKFTEKVRPLSVGFRIRVSLGW